MEGQQVLLLLHLQNTAGPCPGGGLEAVGSEEVGTKRSFVRHIHLHILSISVNFDLDLKCPIHMSAGAAVQPA